MSHDANQSKELAKQELAKFEQIVSEERKLREKARMPSSVATSCRSATRAAALLSGQSRVSWWGFYSLLKAKRPGNHAFS